MRNLERLKQYFEIAELPETLDGDDRFYDNPKRTIEILIYSAENNPTDTRAHKRAIKNLNVLIHDLENKENWNIKRDMIEGVFKY